MFYLSDYHLTKLENDSLLEMEGASNFIEVILPNTVSGFKNSIGEVLRANIINNADYSIYNNELENKKFPVVLLDGSEFFKKLESNTIIFVENKDNSELPVLSYQWLDSIVRKSNNFSLEDYLI